MRASIKASSLVVIVVVFDTSIFARIVSTQETNLSSHSIGQRTQHLVCVCFGCSCLVKISTTPQRYMAIVERFFVQFRLINGLLREFAIYYLSSDELPANNCTSTLQRYTVSVPIDVRRRWTQKNYQLFSLWFSMALRSSISHLRIVQKRRTKHQLAWKLGRCAHRTCCRLLDQRRELQL